MNTHGSKGLCTAAFATWGFEARECTDDCDNSDHDGFYLVRLYTLRPLEEQEYDQVGGTTFHPDKGYIIAIQIYDRAILLHEIGHVLIGTFYHSQNPDDLMFPIATQGKLPSANDILLARLASDGKKFYCQIN